MTDHDRQHHLEMHRDRAKKFGIVLRIMESAGRQGLAMAIHPSDLEVMREVDTMLKGVVEVYRAAIACGEGDREYFA